MIDTGISQKLRLFAEADTACCVHKTEQSRASAEIWLSLEYSCIEAEAPRDLQGLSLEEINQLAGSLQLARQKTTYVKPIWHM